MLARRPLAAAATAMTAALLALAALSGCATANAASDAGSPAAVGSSSASGERVAVIGDSIESGLGLEPSEAWPALVAAKQGWRLSNLSVPGAGFVAQGSDGNDFSAQVDTAIAGKAQLVLIGASDNDLGDDADEVTAAMQKSIVRLSSELPDAQIVGFNALSGQASDDDLAAVDASLRQAVLDVGGTWLDLGQPYRGRAGLVQDDDEHPTLPGQQAIAAVAEAKLGL
ncbi:SGNH/GDSL hydrolase family protein [Leifsonia sp. fls2-241-R2A-40a]|uniref:SGNH/GDSL hydrolase family protein n=1 Tax=Leifsonia sp. fls2-241-R2A-40a TaxID=3040290 RepID=UPI00254C02A3|nr:SGNH/GDSL hydrolase family protein [Leifsonia sp. fls2-241-R2A-40a]